MNGVTAAKEILLNYMQGKSETHTNSYGCPHGTIYWLCACELAAIKRWWNNDRT